jgi:predicted dehydrogenase
MTSTRRCAQRCASGSLRGIGTHRRVAASAARAGKHVYVDKPLAATLAEAQDFLQAAKAARIKTQMFSMVRTALGQRAKAIVESGRLGSVLGMHAELFFAKGSAGTADLTSPRREKSEHGPFTFVDSKREMFTIGLYPIVLFHWLTGFA